MPRTAAKPAIQAGSLLLIDDAPRFSRTVYAAYSMRPHDPALLQNALAGLRRLTGSRGAPDCFPQAVQAIQRRNGSRAARCS